MLYIDEMWPDVLKYVGMNTIVYVEEWRGEQRVFTPGG
jgi:hypothetical protein